MILAPILDGLLQQIEDPLPDEFRRGRELPDLADALDAVHRPGEPGQAADGRRRLAYDELLLLQLGVMMKRRHLRETLKAPALELTTEIDQRIRGRIPFALTADQDQVQALDDDVRVLVQHRRAIGDGRGLT